MIARLTSQVLGASTLALLVAFAPAIPAAADGAAGQVAEAFCKTRLTSDEAAVGELLTPSLRDAIKVAEDRNQVIAEANPDEKPPFGDGIPYQSFMDAPDGCTPGAPVEKGSVVEVPVTYAFDDTPSAGWTDTLVMAPAGDGYLIDDIVFVGAPDDSEPVRLRSVLLDAFDQ